MILINNENLLRQKCEDVTLEEVPELVKRLEEELNTSNKQGRPGIGLAAPQIGIFKKIAIIRFGDVSINLVNAEIEQKFDEFTFKEEGCLSFPGRVFDTKRYFEVVVSNNLVEPHRFVANDLLAVVCQHEIDHYSGSLFMDHIAEVKKPVVVDKVGVNDPCPCGSGKKFKKCCRV